MPPLLQTKLSPPALPRRLVPRPRLAARLNEGLAAGAQVTLISAPAGFGKTTFVCAWLASLAWPVAWLSLDPADDDPARFFTYLLAALQAADPRLGRETRELLRGGSLPPPELLVTTLVNELVQLDRPLLLVLDDLQAIQNTDLLHALELLLAHLPLRLHLILLTREDPALPLARLRANHGLSELRAADLRFTPPEVDAFMNELMGHALSAADVAVLADRTEGWIAGVQLAELSLRGRAAPSAFIRSLSGTHRAILSYLVEQVLSGQPDDVRRFLLETSFLETLCGPLCDAVTGRAGSAALLEQLWHANLFLVALDDEGRWYRYHHLFADLLRSQLQRAEPKRVLVLRDRASAWYEAQGMFSEAVAQALATPDYARAVRLIDEHARTVLLQGYAQTLQDWLYRLPPEWRATGPRANIAFTGSLVLHGRIADAQIYIENAEAAAAERARAGAQSQADEIRAEALSLRGVIASLQGDHERGIELARAGVALAPPGDLYLQGMTRFALGSTCHNAGHLVEALDVYREALPLCEAAGATVIAMLIVGSLTLLYLLVGRLHAAADLCRQVIASLEKPGEHPSPALATVYSTYSAILYEWDDLPAARAFASRCLAAGERGGHVAPLAHGHLLVARISQAEGDLPAARLALERAADLLRYSMPGWIGPRVVTAQVALALARDDPAAAARALSSFGVPLDPPWLDAHELLYLAHLRLLLYLARQDPQGQHLPRALALADHLLTAAETAGRQGRLVEILALRALLLAHQGELPRALQDLNRSLALSEPEKYRRLYLDEGAPMARLLAAARVRGLRTAYSAQLLSAFPSHLAPAPSPADLVEPLTEHELSVLRLLAQDLTYAEIARALVISVNTVRFHVQAIYGKLGVRKRAAALARARELGLL